MGVVERSIAHLLAISLIFTCSAKAQAPDGPCTDTGPLCMRDCSGGPDDGDYQWCGGCRWFLQCVGGVTYHQRCPGEQVWNDRFKACTATSNTCSECVEYSPSTSGSPGSSTPLPIERLCGSTGTVCVESCPGTANGNYQWCGRCDYFLQCVGGLSYYTACQQNLFYDHNLFRCEFNSETCHCDAPPSACLSNPCLQEGTCNSVPEGGYTCTCRPGWTGSNCQINIDDCENQPCLNGATCFDGDNIYFCDCAAGFTGRHCESEIVTAGSCDSFPCRFGSTCVNQPGGGWSCICPPGFTGVDCFSNINECQSNPCMNGSTCIDMDNGYRCQCRPGFTGSDCNNAIRPCDSSPCFHGGTCRNLLPNNFICDCPEEYAGSRCELVRPPAVFPSCGKYLHKAPSDIKPRDGFHILCYITRQDTDLVDMRCENMVSGIEYYDTGHELLVAGGNYGCWVGRQFPDPDQLNSCHDDYQHDIPLSGCLGCDFMTVCIRYPVDPPPMMTTEEPPQETETFEMMHNK